ncbi:MAG: EamA family transporter [Paucimonas sp.]|nr:EamA family transporter [Paucimonas sp.]
MTSLSRRDWLMVVLLTLAWGINWPIMKIGVQEFPPLTFRVLGMLLGLPLIWFAARMQGLSLALRRDQVGPVIRLAIPNMLVWHALIVYGVRMLSSGRAAILGYTMPVWAVLAGLVFFGDRLPARAWFGIACALGGALLLLSSEFGRLAGQPLGSAIVLLAAATWGYGTVLIQRSRIDMSTISLTFWMMALTALALLVGAVVLERDAWRAPTGAELAAIVYNGLVIFGLVHVAWFRLARLLPPVASGVSVMMIPVLGVFSGAWALGETPHWQDYAAMLLILVAMSAVLLKRRAAALT